jgi:hypothetical protein
VVVSVMAVTVRMEHRIVMTRANLNANALLSEEEESATSQKPKGMFTKKKKERRRGKTDPMPAGSP